MKKLRILIILAILLTVALVPSFAFAAGQRVFDQADLFTAEQETALQQIIEEHMSTFASDLAIVTTTDMEGKTDRAYADDFYDKNELGMESSRDGMLFLIDMDNRELYISTSGSMIDILNDDRINTLLDLQYSYVSDQDYYTAMVDSIKKAEEFMTAGAVSGQYRHATGISAGWVVISILVAAGIAGLVVLIISKVYKKAYHPVPYDYRNEAKLGLSLSQDNLVDTHVTSRYIPPPSSSGSSGGSGSMSSTHSSSSGSTHGGGGRSF